MADDAEPGADDAEPAAVLGRSVRCLLAARGRQGPIVSPMAHWFDGRAVWMTTAADAAKVAALGRDPVCLVAVVPEEQQAGMVASGRARVLSPDQPARFALHAPAITGALSALAARNARSVADYALHASQVPWRWAAHRRVVVRVVLDDPWPLAPPSGPTRVTPALPTALPADVRRRLGGKRVVAVLWDEGGLRVATATWGAGLTLAFADGLPASARPRTGARVAVVAELDTGRPTEAVGAVLHGALEGGDAVVADRAVWWRGFEVGRGEVAAAGDDVPLPR